jgi:hypothetical protein
MMKNIAWEAKKFKETLSSPRGISFGTGDPNVLMATSGHMSQRQMRAYVAKHGPMEAFICELMLSYLYQHWESSLRPALKAATGDSMMSDVFGDLRLIRHALQHEKHKHLAEASGMCGAKMFTWLKQKSDARISGDAFDAIMYSISLDLHRINNRGVAGLAT